MHKGLTCLHAILSTRKKSTCYFASIIVSNNFCFFAHNCGAFKGTIYMHFTHCFCNFPSFSRWRKKFSLMNGNLCTWEHQIIHPIRAVGKNVYFLLFLITSSSLWVLFVQEKKISFGEWLLMADEICDDVCINKQSNEAEHFMTFFQSNLIDLLQD